ncbi:MAG: hypothetical protein RR470_09825 [Vagococcus sp.]|uniref:hypothetical protein n=1 Tax=Vagococcus sp. TaxID=1933889 RepID=UPI002FC8B7B7
MKIKRNMYHFTFLLLASLLIMGGSMTYAEESKEYDSRGSIGFYGSYEYPKESSDTSSSSDIPKTGKVIINAPANSTDSFRKRLLPKTGEKQQRNDVILEIIPILGFFLWLIKKKGDMKNEIKNN